jgi:hypothetical protein
MLKQYKSQPLVQSTARHAIHLQFVIRPHHQPINVPIDGAQSFLMDYT